MALGKRGRETGGAGHQPGIWAEKVPDNAGQGQAPSSLVAGAVVEKGLIAMVPGRHMWGQRSPEATWEGDRPKTWHRLLPEDSMDDGSAMSQFFSSYHWLFF